MKAGINSKTGSKRLSGIELLRIVAMMFVLLGHSYLRINSTPPSEAVGSNCIKSFLDVLLSCVATTGVDIFIAISGWFGINYKPQGLLKYIFQVLFTILLVYGFSIALHIVSFDTGCIKVCLTFYEGYWFVVGYLGLYIISPILNSFIESATKNEYKIVLLSFYIFQCYYSWLSSWYDYYNAYSVLLFAGIYLTTAYLRKYPISWLEKHPVKILVGVVLIMTTIAYTFYALSGHYARQIRDDNPLVILVSILFLFVFKQLRFHNKLINWFAASCFTVFLISYHPSIYPNFMIIMQELYDNYHGLIYGAILILSLMSVYIACTIVDQLRVFTWRGLSKMIFRKG